MTKHASSSLTIEKQAYLVALVGNDGAGKTTQAKCLFDWLSRLGRPVTLHPNESLQPIKEMLSAAAHRAGRESVESLVGLEASQFAYAVLKWNTMLKVQRPLSRKGHFVVMDRYAYCHVASVRSQGLANAAVIEEMFSIFPQPDLTFFIDVTIETAMQRMAQRDPTGLPMPRAYLQGHAAAYRRHERAADFVRIDGEASRDEVWAQIRAHMIRQYAFLEREGG